MRRHNRRRGCYNGTLDHLPERPSMSDVTHILSQIHGGDPSAADQLLPLVYDELRSWRPRRWLKNNPVRRCSPRRSCRGLSAFGGRQRTAALEQSRPFLRCRRRGPARILSSRHARRIACGTEARSRKSICGMSSTRRPDAETVLAVNEAVTQLAEQEPEVASLINLHFSPG